MKILGPTAEDVKKYSKVIDEALVDYKTMCSEMEIEPCVDNFALYLINTLAMRLDGRWRKAVE